MTIFRPRTLVLFAGDILFFTLSLWLSLYLRALAAPSRAFFAEHLLPFSLLFIVWVLVFFVAGLYENRSIVLARRALSATLLVAQVINLSIAALFFFFVPLFGIAPKTLLFIYLPVSFLLILLWRAFLFPRLGLQRPEPALIVGEGQEVGELAEVMRRAHRAPVAVCEVLVPEPQLEQELTAAMERHRARVVVADFSDPRVAAVFPRLYNLLSRGVRFFDSMAVYEEVFGRVPPRVLNEEWLALNSSRYAHTLYDALKRVMDIAAGLLGGLVSLVFYPFIMLAIKLEDGGPAIISMPRVGEGGGVFSFYKFRSMTGNDGADYGPGGKSSLAVTRVGRVLRRTRLDELPQLWNLLRGDLSLIGPRPEAPALVAVYEKEIPYYGVRHLLRPGISGWAQLYHHADPHHKAAVEDTRNKLSYDLYYLKHRSLLLDATIALKTIRRLLAGNA